MVCLLGYEVEKKYSFFSPVEEKDSNALLGKAFSLVYIRPYLWWSRCNESELEIEVIVVYM